MSPAPAPPQLRPSKVMTSMPAFRSRVFVYSFLEYAPPHTLLDAVFSCEFQLPEGVTRDLARLLG